MIVCGFVLLLTTANAAVLFQDVHVLGKVSSSKVNENSGLAASRVHSGVMYGLNDNGDSSHIFALDPVTGSLRATLEIRSAQNYDWEDLCVGTCGQDIQGTCIYIGDIGDHGGDGAKNIIYKVKEPEVISHDASLPVLNVYKFTWGEDDAESLMLDPDGDLYVISKVHGGRAVFAKLPRAGWGSNYPVTIPLENTAILRIHTDHNDPQGADISPDGTELLVKTEDEVLYYPVPNRNYVEVVGHQQPHVVSTYVRRSSGESVAWNAAGTGFYTLPEGRHQTFHFYPKVSSGGGIVG
ncbi:uncharacterized protein [Littorina saxatilis]|uniref:Uncharacterized protein n=1 Tax=Littorina saxatilis TaxID=31220 RepID=A0AAN9G1G2_9CAEN